jgi:hypothetical protein
MKQRICFYKKQVIVEKTYFIKIKKYQKKIKIVI